MHKHYSFFENRRYKLKLRYDGYNTTFVWYTRDRKNCRSEIKFISKSVVPETYDTFIERVAKLMIIGA